MCHHVDRKPCHRVIMKLNRFSPRFIEAIIGAIRLGSSQNKMGTLKLKRSNSKNMILTEHHEIYFFLFP